MEDKPNTNYHLAEAIGTITEGTKTQRHYTSEDKLQAVMAVFMTNSANKASKMCGIPSSTIKHWRSSEWWGDTLLLVKKKKDAELDGKLTGLIDDTIEGIKLALKRGDIKLNKHGEEVIVPVSARDQAAIAKIANDLRKGLRGEVVGENKDNFPNGVKSLEDMLIGIVKDAKAEKSINPIVGEAIDGNKE